MTNQQLSELQKHLLDTIHNGSYYFTMKIEAYKAIAMLEQAKRTKEVDE